MEMPMVSPWLQPPSTKQPIGSFLKESIENFPFNKNDHLEYKIFTNEINSINKLSKLLETSNVEKSFTVIVDSFETSQGLIGLRQELFFEKDRTRARSFASVPATAQPAQTAQPNFAPIFDLKVASIAFLVRAWIFVYREF